MPSSLFYIQKVLSILLLITVGALLFGISRALTKNKSVVTPFQLNWLTVGIFAQLVYGIITLITSNHEHHVEIKYLTYFSFLYLQLYVTKYNLKLNKKLQKVYILFIHLIFNFVTFYSCYDVVKLHLPSADLSYIFVCLYQSKDIILYSFTMVALFYTIYLLLTSRFDYKLSILYVLYSNMMFAFTMILMSCAETAGSVYFIYTIVLIFNIMENIALFKNIHFEKGRILAGR